MALEKLFGPQEIASGDLSISASIDSKKYLAFLENHSHKKAGGAIGGMLTYVFGSSIKIKCACGVEEDLASTESESSPFRMSALVDQIEYNYFIKNHTHAKERREITHEFTPTTLGTIVKLECACGTQKDVTDYQNW
jgi:hypothetical protein